MKFMNGSTQISLDGNKIRFAREELTCYHKRDYGFVVFKTIEFNNENDASHIFREMKDIYSHGYVAGKQETKHSLESGIRKVFNDE